MQFEKEEGVDNDNPKDSQGDSAKGEMKKDGRKTDKYMTKYEKARILGTRALQIRFHLSILVSLLYY